MSRAVRLARQANELIHQADLENRVLTGEERSYIRGLLDEAREVGEIEKSINEVGQHLGAGMPSYASGDSPAAGAWASPGEVFVGSEGFKSIADPTRRAEKWSTGLIELPGMVPSLGMKGTLLEGAGSPGAGSGGGMLPVPQVVPGVVPTLFQPLRAEGLFDANVASGNTVRYVTEGTATSGAAGVAEGGTKPESTLGLSTKDEPVKKVATFLPMSDELMEDAPALMSYINGRLGLFVGLEVERQLWRGTSGGNEVQGLLTSRSVPVYAGGTVAGNKAIQLFKAMNGLRGSAFVEPEWIAIHPTDYQDIRLLTDSAGQLFGGGPFLGSYGGPTQVGQSGQITGAQDRIWNTPVYVTAAIGGAGTAVVGTRANACVWSRGGLRIEASNSHASFFQQDLVAMRAERRLAFTVFRPGAYVEVRLA